MGASQTPDAAEQHGARIAEVEHLLHTQDTWLDASSPRDIGHALEVAWRLIRQGSWTAELQRAFEPLLLQVLGMASRELGRERGGDLRVWRSLFAQCLELAGRAASHRFLQGLRNLYLESESVWWKMYCLRFLGRWGNNVLEQEVVDSLGATDEILVGSAIRYLGDIGSRLAYREIVGAGHGFRATHDRSGNRKALQPPDSQEWRKALPAAPV